MDWNSENEKPSISSSRIPRLLSTLMKSQSYTTTTTNDDSFKAPPALTNIFETPLRTRREPVITIQSVVRRYLACKKLGEPNNGSSSSSLDSSPIAINSHGKRILTPKKASTAIKTITTPVSLQISLPIAYNEDAQKLTRLTQTNTYANARYTKCMPKVVHFTKSGNPPPQTDHETNLLLLPGEASRKWHACKTGFCQKALPLVAHYDSKPTSRLKIDKNVVIIGHHPQCPNRTESCSKANSNYPRSILKNPPQKFREDEADPLRIPVAIQRISYVQKPAMYTPIKNTNNNTAINNKPYTNLKPQRCLNMSIGSQTKK